MTHHQLWSLYKKRHSYLASHLLMSHSVSLTQFHPSLLRTQGLLWGSSRVPPLISEALWPRTGGYYPRSPDVLLPASPLGVISKVACQQAADGKIKTWGHSGDLGCWQETENKFSWILRERCVVGLGPLALVGVAEPWKKQKASSRPI